MPIRHTELAQTIVKKLIEESSPQGDVRFDLDCRVEVWVTEEDLRLADGFDDIVAGGGDLEEKVAQLKELAVEVARERLSKASSYGLEITAGSLSLSDINVDRISWEALASPENDEFD